MSSDDADRPPGRPGRAPRRLRGAATRRARHERRGARVRALSWGLSLLVIAAAVYVSYRLDAVEVGLLAGLVGAKLLHMLLEPLRRRYT